MRSELSKEIKSSLDSNKSLNDDFDKSIIAEVDKSFVFNQNKITEGIIKIGLSEFYKTSVQKLQKISKLLKKVDLSRPNKQNLMGKFMGIRLDADLLSSTTALYEELKYVPIIQATIDKLLERVDKLEEEFMDMVDNHDITNINAINKTNILAQMEGLKSIKLDLLELEHSYNLIATYPDIKKFMYYWTKYKRDGHFPINCVFNDQVYKFEDSMEEFSYAESNIVEAYNILRWTVKKIRKFSNNFDNFMLYVSMAYGILANRFHEGELDSMIEVIDAYKEKLLKKKEESKNKNNIAGNDIDSKIYSLEIMKSEFIKLKEEVRVLLEDGRLHAMGVRAGSFLVEEIFRKNR